MKHYLRFITTIIFWIVFWTPYSTLFWLIFVFMSTSHTSKLEAAVKSILTQGGILWTIGSMIGNCLSIPIVIIILFLGVRFNHYVKWGFMMISYPLFWLSFWFLFLLIISMFGQFLHPRAVVSFIVKVYIYNNFPVVIF